VDVGTVGIGDVEVEILMAVFLGAVLGGGDAGFDVRRLGQTNFPFIFIRLHY
jgi:hypothetical protein